MGGECCNAVTLESPFIAPASLVEDSGIPWHIWRNSTKSSPSPSFTHESFFSVRVVAFLRYRCRGQLVSIWHAASAAAAPAAVRGARLALERHHGHVLHLSSTVFAYASAFVRMEWSAGADGRSCGQVASRIMHPGDGGS